MLLSYLYRCSFFSASLFSDNHGNNVAAEYGSCGARITHIDIQLHLRIGRQRSSSWSELHEADHVLDEWTKLSLAQHVPILKVLRMPRNWVGFLALLHLVHLELTRFLYRMRKVPFPECTYCGTTGAFAKDIHIVTHAVLVYIYRNNATIISFCQRHIVFHLGAPFFLSHFSTRLLFHTSLTLCAYRYEISC